MIRRFLSSFMIFGNPFSGVALTLALLLTGPSPLLATTDATQEYRVKGAFLYNFILFVDWPAAAFATDQSPFTIGILGKNPFGTTLESLNSQSVKNRKIVVRSLASVEDAKECQLLFISASERSRLDQILTALHNTPVLTVSDLEGFVGDGGMIDFIILEDKVRFEINLKEALIAKLRISSQLLKLARDVIE